MRWKLQVRCFRLKEAAKNITLFPDTASLSVNGYSIKDFEPLHKQSCLKFRKDEPIYIESKHIVPKVNKALLLERQPSK